MIYIHIYIYIWYIYNYIYIYRILMDKQIYMAIKHYPWTYIPQSLITIIHQSLVGSWFQTIDRFENTKKFVVVWAYHLTVFYISNCSAIFIICLTVWTVITAVTGCTNLKIFQLEQLLLWATPIECTNGNHQSSMTIFPTGNSHLAWSKYCEKSGESWWIKKTGYPHIFPIFKAIFQWLPLAFPIIELLVS